jgi:hypothetical protein
VGFNGIGERNRDSRFVVNYNDKHGINKEGSVFYYF